MACPLLAVRGAVCFGRVLNCCAVNVVSEQTSHDFKIHLFSKRLCEVRL